METVKSKCNSQKDSLVTPAVSKKTAWIKFIHDIIASKDYDRNTVYCNGEELTDVVIMTDCYGNSQITTPQDNKVDERNIFKDTLRQYHQKSTKKNNVEVYLKNKQTKLHDLLLKGSQSYKNKWYSKAIDLFESAIKLIETDSYPDEFHLDVNDRFVMKYALAISNCALNEHGSLLTALDILTNLEINYGYLFPSLYLSLTKVHLRLKNFESAKTTIEKGLKATVVCQNLVELYWPNSNMLLEDTEGSSLLSKMKILQNECKIAHLPDATCYYSLCSLMGNNNKNIYYDSPDFNGYISVICSALCQFVYHPSCWKAYKKANSQDAQKTNLIDTECCTPSCWGHICTITTYNSACKIKSVSTSKSKISEKCLDLPKLKIKQDNVPLFKPPVRQVAKKQQEIETKPIQLDSMMKGLKIEAPEFIPSKYTDNSNLEGSGDSVHIKCSQLNVEVPEFLPRQSLVNDDLSAAFQSNNSWSTGSYAGASVSEMENKVDYPEFVPNVHDKSVAPILGFHNSMKTKSMQTETIDSPPAATVCHRTVQTIDNVHKRDVGVQTYEGRPSTRDAVALGNQGDVEKCPSLTRIVEQTHERNLELSNEMKRIEMKAMQDKSEAESKFYRYEMEIDELKRKVVELQSSVQTQKQSEMTQQKKLVALQTLLSEQMHYNQYLLTSFITSYKDKCKRVLWELNDMAPILTNQSTPNLHDVTVSCNNWNQALTHAANCHSYVLKHFEVLFQKMTVQELTEHKLPVKVMPELPSEPPYLIAQYFKSVLNINKKLEHQLLCQNFMLNNRWQRSVSPSPPLDMSKKAAVEANAETQQGGEFPTTEIDLVLQTLNDAIPNCSWEEEYTNESETSDNSKSYSHETAKDWIQKSIVTLDRNKFIDIPNALGETPKEATNETKHPTGVQENKCLVDDFRFLYLYPNISNPKSPENRNAVLQKLKDGDAKKTSVHKIRDLIGKRSCAVHEESGVTEDRSYTIQKTKEFVEARLMDAKKMQDAAENKTTEKPKPVEIYKHPNACRQKTVVGDGSGTAGNAQRDITGPVGRIELDPSTSGDTELSRAGCSTSNTKGVDAPQVPLRPADNKGLHAIMSYLKKHIPNVPVNRLVEAVAELRRRHGKLSGMTLKNITGEVRQMLLDGADNNSDGVKSKVTKSAWAKIDNSCLEWDKNNVDANCSICFEYLDKKTTTELRCQHSFHVSCIKTWLQTNSICPICRVFTRLDDEFPPLA